ncbi:hypothetical protein OS493_033035 [Desmophyllum pertusum]|uniref:C-type lectin domain-containing protein n=1 Tax=Desmophyllum pertusum TaxID=174260 RepID=A0A9W9ZK01_9CNID|nr:hypothetical protein OS493_033035 [Desmophyllum pertusum]
MNISKAPVTGLSAYQKSWSDGMRMCREKGADLIKVSSAEENNFLRRSGKKWWLALRRDTTPQEYLQSGMTAPCQTLRIGPLVNLITLMETKNVQTIITTGSGMTWDALLLLTLLAKRSQRPIRTGAATPEYPLGWGGTWNHVE